MSGVQQQNTEHRWKGWAMTALPKNTTALQIFCPELTPGNTTGVFKPGRTESTVSHTDIKGITRETTASTTNHIVAEWRTLSNKDYPPTVGQGEQVVLFQQANSDKFYWDAVGRDPSTRTTEVYRQSISATPNTGEDKTDENTYSEEWNSRDGYVTLLKTSSANGEPVSLFFGFNTKTGTMLITDNSGAGDGKTPANFFTIDFVNRVFQITNNDGSVFRVDKKSAYLTVMEDFIVSAKRKILFDTPLLIINKAQIGAVIVNAASVAINANQDIVLTAARAGINAVTKISKSLVAGATRLLSYTTGAVGSSYAPVTAAYTDTTPTMASNSTDDDTGGEGMRTVAAWKDMAAAFAATTAALEKLDAKVGAGIDTSGITSNASSAEIKDSKGT